MQRRRRSRGLDAKVNMLILMSDTGGGHRASAQALEAALEEMYPGRIAVTMVDIFTEHSRWPYSHSVPAYQVRREEERTGDMWWIPGETYLSASASCHSSGVFGRNWEGRIL